MVNIYKKTKNVFYYSLLSLILGCNTELTLPDNIPPYTKIIKPDNNEVFNTDSVEVEWDGYDVDGKVIGYFHRLDNNINIYPLTERIVITDSTQDKKKLFTNLRNGYYRFEVKAQDDYGDYDPIPEIRYFLIDVKK